MARHHDRPRQPNNPHGQGLQLGLYTHSLHVTAVRCIHTQQVVSQNLWYGEVDCTIVGEEKQAVTWAWICNDRPDYCYFDVKGLPLDRMHMLLNDSCNFRPCICQRLHCERRTHCVYDPAYNCKRKTCSPTMQWMWTMRPMHAHQRMTLPPLMWSGFGGCM